MTMLSNKYYSSKQENLIADYLGWSVVSGSGSRSTHPGDIQNEDWLGECKTHRKSGQQIQFIRKVWDKLETEAMAKFKFPALFVDDGSQTIEATWVMYKRPTACKVSTVEYPTLKSWDSDNILFYSTTLMKDRRESHASYIPVVYEVKLSGGKTIKISTLTDFHEMFVKYGRY